jgi:hypothetical protein
LKSEVKIGDEYASISSIWLEERKDGVVENVTLIGGLIGVQFICAGNAEIMSYSMSLGIGPLSIVILTSIATFLILLPAAFCFER